jgi:hypothetical protein
LDFIVAYAAPEALGQDSPRPERLTIWLGTWRRVPPGGSEIRFIDSTGSSVHSPRRVPAATDPMWQTFGRAGDEVGQGRFLSLSFFNMPASPATITCEWRLLADSSLIASCQYRPIPTTLTQVSSNGPNPQQPITIMLSSCYWYDGATPETLQDAMNFIDSRDLRPDIVAMIGDNVYVDQLPGEFAFEKTAEDLEQFISLRYLNTWRQLRPILERGQHLHITDDHEYWNDYPFKPPPAWLALQNDSYRELMSDLTERAADLIQLHNLGGPGLPVGEIRLTENVSMFVADTRRTRSDRMVRGFLEPTLFNLLLEWLNGLNGPGILVLGQPIVHKPLGYFDTLDTLTDGFFELVATSLLPGSLEVLLGLLADLLTYISDRNLPWYTEQYLTLLNALQNAAHDVLILAGDIHIGRISQIWMLTNQGPPRKIYEVVSSPLRILPDAESAWNEGTALPFIPADPISFTEQPTPGDDVSGTVEYLSAVPTESGEKSQDHFMILRLYEGQVPGSLLTRITPFVLSDGPGDPEELSSIDITLNDGLSQRGVIVAPDQIWLEATVGEESAKSFAVTNYDDQPVSIKILPSLEPPFVWEARDSSLDPGDGFRHTVTYQPVELTTHESGPDSAVLTVDLGGRSEVIGLLGVGLSAETPPPRRSRRRRAV